MFIWRKLPSSPPPKKKQQQKNARERGKMVSFAEISKPDSCYQPEDYRRYLYSPN